MCHIFSIHSSIDGHLDCFHILVIVNNACKYLFKNLFSFLLGIYSEMGLLDHVNSYIFNFLRNPYIVFHTGCTNLHSHLRVYRGSLFSIFSPKLAISYLFDDSHSTIMV